MSKSTGLRARMKKDKAVRNGVVVGGAMGALTLLGGALITKEAAERDTGAAVGAGVASAVGVVTNAAIWGAIAYGATKVFAD